MSDYNVTGTLKAKFIKNPDQLEVRAIGWSKEQYADARICYLNADNTKAIYPAFSYDVQKGHFLISHEPLTAMEHRVRVKWKLCLQYTDANGECVCRRLTNAVAARKIKEVKDETVSQAFRYGSSIHEFKKRGKWYVVLPYYNIKGRMGFLVRQKQRSLLNIVKAKVTSCKIEGSVLSIRGSVKKDGYKPCSVVLSFRADKESEACEYEMQTTIQQRPNGSYTVSAKLDLAQYDLKPVYWDVMLKLTEDTAEDFVSQDKLYYVNMYNTSKAFEDQFLRLRQEVAYRTKDGNIFFPFVTKRHTLGFKYREVIASDSFGFRLKERIARKIYEINPGYWNRRNICLVYEKYCLGAQDNGYYFFRYCMEHRKKAEKKAKFFYVIDPKSPEYKKVAKYGSRVVKFLSLRHMIYLQAAKLLISTDSKAHAYAWRQKGSILHRVLDEKKNVFLQHGMIGLKNITKLYNKNAKAGCDLFIASSAKEKSIIHNKLRYPNEEIAVTGLARWDGLVDQSKGRREILVMPTWRGWLDSVSDEDFAKSEYYKNYQSLLKNKRLLAFLEEKDYQVTFYLHPILRNYIHHFKVDSDRIQLVAVGECPLNEIMMRSSVMITDYSSASWDMFYMRKPVVFYQFDEEDYNLVHGSYMDFEKDLFGDRAKTVEEVVESLIRCVEAGCTLKTEYEKKWEKAFAYVDQNNSKRILEQILKRDWGL